MSIWRTWFGTNDDADWSTSSVTTSIPSITMPTWVSGTTSSTTAWIRYATTTATTSTAATPLYYWAGNEQEYAAQRAQQLWQQQALAQQQQLAQFGSLAPAWAGNRLASIARPAIITLQDEARRDRELYRRAVEEHDEQEAARLLRLVERHEVLAEDQRRAVEEQRQRHAEETRRREAAKSRARELLFEHLTPAQRETFDANGWFIVEGGRSKTRYRIRAVEHMAANVDVLNAGGNRTHRLCAHVPLGRVPLGDQLLAQKIMLELAEDDFLRTANRHAA